MNGPLHPPLRVFISSQHQMFKRFLVISVALSKLQPPSKCINMKYDGFARVLRRRPTNVCRGRAQSEVAASMMCRRRMCFSRQRYQTFGSVTCCTCHKQIVILYGRRRGLVFLRHLIRFMAFAIILFSAIVFLNIYLHSHLCKPIVKPILYV